MNILSRLGLDERAQHLPSALSGGEEQRVAIARALMNGGPVILADEPTGALDGENSEKVLRMLEQLAAKGHTVIIVSHNAEIAARARRCIELRNGCIVGDSNSAASGAAGADNAFADSSRFSSRSVGVFEMLLHGWAQPCAPTMRAASDYARCCRCALSGLRCARGRSP